MFDFQAGTADLLSPPVNGQPHRLKQYLGDGEIP